MEVGPGLGRGGYLSGSEGWGGSGSLTHSFRSPPDSIHRSTVQLDDNFSYSGVALIQRSTSWLYLYHLFLLYLC